jgi:hypothetical protein
MPAPSYIWAQIRDTWYLTISDPQSPRFGCADADGAVTRPPAPTAPTASAVAASILILLMTPSSV